MTEKLISEDEILAAMSRYGGSFVRQLAFLYRHGDLDNQQILRVAFAHYFEEYEGLARKEAAMR